MSRLTAGLSAELPLSIAAHLTAPAARPRTVPLWTAAAQAQNPDASRRWFKRLKFFIRAWMHRRYTRAWLARLVQPDLAPLWLLRPRLAAKLQRPYVCCAWDVPVRCAALLGHYDQLPRLFAPEVRAAIYRDGLTALRLVNPVSRQDLDLGFFYHDRFEKEGELTLAVRDAASGLMLAGLTFSLVRNGNERLAIIGGLQAANDPATRGLIHAAAKALHGFRPKALALWCLQQLVPVWSLTQIQAVGDAQHVWRHWRKRRKFAASYDEFWGESDGCRQPGGNWVLPLQAQPRSREALKPNRRRQHERRYALLAALQPQLRAAVTGLATGGAGPGRKIPEFVLPDSSETERPAAAPAPLHQSY